MKYMDAKNRKFLMKVVSLIERVASKVELEDIAISDADATEMGRVRIVEDLHGLAQGLFETDPSDNVSHVVGFYMHFQSVRDMCEANLIEMHSGNPKDPRINQFLEAYNNALTTLFGRLREIYEASSIEDQKFIKRYIRAHIVDAGTPQGVKDQAEVLSKYIYQVDGEWRLRPVAMDLEISEEYLAAFDPETALNGFNIEGCLAKKSETYEWSTAGLRGRNNILYPWSGDELLNFFGEAITAFSQALTLAVNARRADSGLQGNISELRGIIDARRSELEPVCKAAIYSHRRKEGQQDSDYDGAINDSMILAEILAEEGPSRAKELFGDICGRLTKLVGGEVRHNTTLYQELFTRITAGLGYTVHTQPIEGEDKTSIWMASFLIFTKDLDGGNYATCSHGPEDNQCIKDLSDEGAQMLPDMSRGFSQVNEWVVGKIKQNGRFVIHIAAEDDNNIHRDVDGVEEYSRYLESSVATKENLALVGQAVEADWDGVIQDCAHGCMGPLMRKIYRRFGLEGVVRQVNADYDPWQGGLGKAIVLKKEDVKYTRDGRFNLVGDQKLVGISYWDEGVDASNAVVVPRFNYERTMVDEVVGRKISNTDPDGDRFVQGEVLENTPEMIAKCTRLGIKHIELNDEKIYAYFSPNKFFLMTTHFYAERLRLSGKIGKGDTVAVIKTAQTSYAFNQWCKAYEAKWGIKVVCIEPTVGFKEIAAAERDIERGLRRNEALVAEGQEPVDIIVTDALGHEINCGRGRVIMLSGSEESGGQELASPEGIRSGMGRHAIGNREKSAGVTSILAIVMGADLHLKGQTLPEYWDSLIRDYGLTFFYDDRHDEVLFDTSIPDPGKLKAAMAEGNQKKILNSRLLWNLARAHQEGQLSIGQVRDIILGIFQDPELQQKCDIKDEEWPAIKGIIEDNIHLLDDLTEAIPIVTAGGEPAKDGIYLFFREGADPNGVPKMYLDVRPSGTDPKIKGYYNGVYLQAIGLIFGRILAGYCVEQQDWETTDYYEVDDVK